MSELLTFRLFLELESRVRRIERHLHLTPEAASGDAGTSQEPIIASASRAATPVAAIAMTDSEIAAGDASQTDTMPDVTVAAAEVSPAHATPPPLPTMAMRETVSVAQIGTMMSNAAAKQVLPYQPQATPAPRKDPHSTLEQWIGLNWTGWVGAIVLVIGAALGIKYAYDQGWLGGVPKEVRLALCFAGGLGLLCIGEWVDRKINRVSAACIFGAGVATLFVVSYAGFGYFELYAQSTAFVLMAISTFIGAGVAMRKNLVSIAALSLIGGNLAPIILQTHEPRFAALLGYVLTLQIIALVLTAWGNGGKWWILRGFAIAMPAFWVGVVFNQSHETLLPVIFSCIFAALSQAELIFSDGRKIQLANGLAAACSILVTSLLTLALVYGFQSDGRFTQGIAVLVTAGVCGAMAFALWNRRKELATSYRIQSAVLALVSVPIMLDGRSVVLCWGGLSLAYAIVGRQSGSKWGRWFAATAWAGAVAYLGLWCANDAMAREMFFRDVPEYLFLAAVLTAIGHALTWIITREDDDQRASRCYFERSSADHAATEVADAFSSLAQNESNASGSTVESAISVAAYERSRAIAIISSLGQLIDLAAGAMLVVALMNALPAWYATAAIAGYAWLLMLAGQLLGRRVWAILSGAAMVFALVKWGSVDLLGDRLAPTYQANQYMPVVNPIMGVGTLLAGSVIAMYALQRQTIDEWLDRRQANSPALWVGSLVMFVMTFGLSMEVDRMVAQVRASSASPWPWMQLELMGLSMLWTAALAIHAGLVAKLSQHEATRRRWTITDSRWMAALAVKFVVLDTLGWWLLNGPAAVTPIANLQLLTGTIIAAGLGLFWWLRDRDGRSSRFIGAMMLAILLLCGTVEIDRAFEHTNFAGSTFADPRLAKQVAISIYWAIFAVAAVIGGFRLRIAELRYFGLALLAISLCKVVAFDLQEVGRGYRILSFLGLGALLLMTSVVYGKLSPKLLGEKPTA